MSKSNSKSKDSLAKCYGYLSNKGKKKNGCGPSKSVVCSVEEKLDAAQKRGLFIDLLLENPTATEAPNAQVKQSCKSCKKRACFLH